MSTEDVPARKDSALHAPLPREELLRLGELLRAVQPNTELNESTPILLSAYLGDLEQGEREMAIVSALAVSRGGYVNLGVVREEAARVAGVLAPDFDEALVRTMALLRAPHRLTVESTTCRSYFAHDPVELMYEHPAVVALARTPSRVEDADDNPTIRAQLRDDYRAIAARHDREVLRPGGIKRAREREAVERAAVRERLAEIDPIDHNL